MRKNPRKQLTVLLYLLFLAILPVQADSAGITAELLSDTAKIISGQPETFGVSGAAEYPPDFETPGMVPLADLPPETMVDGRYFQMGSLFDMGGGQVVITYSLSDHKPYTGDDDDDYYPEEAGSWPDFYWASYNLTTGTLDAAAEAPFLNGGWLQLCRDPYRGKSLLLTNYSENGTEYIWYNEYLGEMLSFQADDTEMESLTFPETGKGYYLDSEKQIRRLLISEDEVRTEEVGIRPLFSVTTIGTAFQADDGCDYLIVGGWNGRFEPCLGILDTSTGEFARTDPQDKAGYYMSDNSIIWPLYPWDNQGEEIRHGYRVCVDGHDGFEAVWNSEEMTDVHCLSDGRVLFMRSNFTPWDESDPDQEIRLLSLDMWLIDSATGKLLGTHRFELQDGERYLYFEDPVCVPESDAILLCAADNLRGIKFFLWNPAFSEKMQEVPQTAPFSWKQAEALEMPSDWDPSAFTPGPLPEEMAGLKRKAVQLGRKYGFRLLISEECRTIYGGYAIHPVNDRKIVEESLDVMEHELRKYPAGFFRKLTGGNDEGLEILLAGTLHGTENETLETAGGFVNYDSEKTVLVLDIRYPSDLKTSLHHELSHIIDGRVLELSDYELLTNDDWERLNPEAPGHDSFYTWTYTQYGYDDLMDWTCYAGDPSMACFVDTYSMTFPTEDRARLFEFCMCDEDECRFDWEECPVLIEKMNYYAECIRETLGDDSWGSVRWERFLTDEAENEAA